MGRFIYGVLLAATLWLPSFSWAQSACTAMWATVDNDGGGAGTTQSLRYYNFSTNQWTRIGTANLTGNPNALAGDPTSGLLYYLNRTTGQLRSYNLNTNADALVGTVSAPPAPATAANIIGSTIDSSGRLFLYATNGGSPAFAVVAQVSKATAATVTSWVQVRTTAGATPTIAGSGDLNTDQANISYIVSNTNPPTYHVLDLNPASASFGRTNSPALTITGAGGGLNNAGVAVDPLTGQAYFGNGNANSVTYSLDVATGAATLINNTTSYWVTDMGNCVSPPAAPTITKSFTPVYRSGSPGTATLTLIFGNSNSVPFWLTTDFRDVLPAGMRISTTPALTSTCSSPSGTPTTAAGSNSVTFVAGGRIPAGGCQVTVRVSATASVSPYTNTIAAGSLTTTAGSNAAAASDTFQVGVDFEVAKFQRQDATDPLQTGTLIVGAGLTMQYVLTISNSTDGGTGTATFTDTLPTLITPVLSVTPVMAGGGTCNTTSAITGGRTRISGTVTSAPPGSTCTVTIVARASTTAGTFQNTVTIAGATGTTDPDAVGNTATVTTVIHPAALLTISKTNAAAGVAAGQTTTYTITVANLGPADAPGTLVTDSPGPGLSCISMSCSTNGSASCPPALDLPTFQSTGLTITPTFAANSSVTFHLTCEVTATGQ
ncbi:MAG: DUF11 domain-containing protein [Burkholderiales bacterium]|nr:DUF11 domain-containing protein [Burkholderiales bacterium]